MLKHRDHEQVALLSPRELHPSRREELEHRPVIQKHAQYLLLVDNERVSGH